MMSWRAFEFDENERFTEQNYAAMKHSTGWSVRKENSDVAVIGNGYTLMRVVCCGICSTDLARKHLPFALPQVTGHEVATDHCTYR
jgi:D-arabinose 1-dehydrogenase-like Zn-dependent alcohol dehydrogenase